MRRRQKIPPVQIENLYGMQAVRSKKKQMRVQRSGGGGMVGKQTKSLCAAYAPTTKIAELFESSLIKWHENCRPVVPKPSRMLVTESGGKGNR